MPRGDGKLMLTFVDIGQGDCILITCPNGKTAMIDCGTARWGNTSYGEVNNILNSDDFLANYNKLDVLILTHPDKDHYNELKEQLDAQIVIDQLYYSAELENYYMDSVGTWLNYTANVTGKTKFTQNALSQQIAKKLILDGGSGCKIYLLAGNVRKGRTGKDGNDERNPGSLVTLIEMNNTKFLLCGDATWSTERFVLANFANDIQDVEIMQAPHHGSTTSSHKEFVEKANPKVVVISVAKDSGSVFKHPRYTVMEKYVGGDRLEDYDDHTVFYWKELEETNETTGKKEKVWYLLSEDFEQNLQSTGSGGSQSFEYDST